MKDRSIEKLLYKIAALLVVCGILACFFPSSESYLGLHLILSGLITGVVAIFLYMKHENDMEQKRTVLKQKQQLRKQ